MPINDPNQTTPERRDRGVGADLGQHGASPQKPPTSPNKSKLGDKTQDEGNLYAKGSGARAPEMDRSDRKNVGDTDG